MADKAISELIAAERITTTDMFVLEQNGTAKKLTGQVLLNWLTAAADGHGGIQSIVKRSTNGLVDTYRITLADTTYFDFLVTNGRAITSVKQTNVSGLTRTYEINFNDGGTQAFTVTDGRGITEIAKTSTSGLVDTYTISLNDGTSETFTVTNGEKGNKGDNTYTWIKYSSQKPTASSHSFGDVADDWIGIYYGTSETAPTDWTQYEWFQIKGEKGDTGDPATLVSNVVEYQVSDSGTIIPSGAWGTSIPVVAQGRYLWTRTTTTFNTGSSAVSYSVSRMGLDGSGSVSSVANISPDENGNVPLTAADIGAVPVTGGDMTGELRMNGQTISGLNAPTANDQAATKGYVDNAKPDMTGYATETYVNQQVKKAAPRNLLDNSDFRNPVNQRGQQIYNGDVYGIDRWKGYSTATVLSVSDGSIIVSGDSLIQYFAATENGVYSAFAKFADGVVPVATYYNAYLKCRYIVLPPGQYLWAAVYEGEYTIDDLPEYQPKGYGAELAECQRYYYRLEPWLPMGNGIVEPNGLDVSIPIPVGVKMRVVPSITEGVNFVLRVAGGEVVHVNKTPEIYMTGNVLSAVYRNVFTDNTRACMPVFAFTDTNAYEFHADL